VNDQTPASGNDTGLPVKNYDFEHEACMLVGLIGGIDALYYAAIGGDDLQCQRARNALPPYIDAVIGKANALYDRIAAEEPKPRASASAVKS